MLDKLLKRFTANVFKPIKHDMASRCSLEIPQDEFTFVTEEGGVLSFLKLNGVQTIPYDEESLRIFNSFQTIMSSALDRGCHSFNFVFENDPTSVERDIKDATAPVVATIERMGLDIKDVYDDWRECLALWCQTEKNWLVIYTSPAAIDENTLKRSMRDRSEYIKKVGGVPNLASAQDPMKLIKDVLLPHQTLCQAFVEQAKNVGYDIKLMNVLEALRDLRFCIDPDHTSDKWTPALTLTRKEPPISLVDDAIPSDFWFPKIGTQLFGQDLTVEKHQDYSGEMVRYGDRYYSTMAMEVFPETVLDFSSLFVAIDGGIPWRISIDIRPSGMKAQAVSRMYTKIFGWWGETNKKIKNGFDYIEQRLQSGDRDVAITFMATTWANNPRDLSTYESRVVRAIQTWGICQVITRLGDPVAAWCATLPGFTRKRCATVTAAPLSEILPMLPLQRPCGPWQEGAAITRSIDGKVMPIQPNSSLQTTWNDLFYSPPGGGKSVLLNTLTMAMVLNPGLTNLPRISHLDVGSSASGVVRLLRSALPANRKHEVQFIKFTMDEKYAINPFDTELGCRYPTQIERDTLVNLLCIFVTPTGREHPYDMSTEMAGVIVDEVYKKFSDDGGDPKQYEPGRSKVVDDALYSMNIEYAEEDRPSWWALVDLFFLKKGMLHEATEAQKYAVPVLDDLIMAIRSDQVKDLFGREAGESVMAGNGQRLTDVFNTAISSARREYPVLSGVTKFDVSDARIVIMDLGAVARGSNEATKKRAAIMYMLGRQATTKSFYLSEEMVEIAPEGYRDYHRKRIKEIRGDKKAIIYDEFHNTGGMASLRRQVVADMREGRKANIRVALSSQLLSDFDAEMVKVASSIFILKVGTEGDIKDVSTTFNLSAGAENILRNSLYGPQKWGAPFLGYFQTKKGKYSQMFVNTIGPVLSWALSTTAEDMEIREALYGLIPEVEARQLLKDNYPTGCSEAVQLVAKRLSGESKQRPTEVIVEQLMARYQENREIAARGPVRRKA